MFDIGLLAGRLVEVTGWLRAQPRAARPAIGYFGASTGAAAALRAAAEPGADIAAVVSCSSSAGIHVVLDLNRRAQRSYGG